METERVKIESWGDWINWIMYRWDCRAKDVAEKIEVTESFVSAVRKGRKKPGRDLQAVLASYEEVGGPKPPKIDDHEAKKRLKFEKID